MRHAIEFFNSALNSGKRQGCCRGNSRSSQYVVQVVLAAQLDPFGWEELQFILTNLQPDPILLDVSAAGATFRFFETEADQVGLDLVGKIPGDFIVPVEDSNVISVLEPEDARLGINVGVHAAVPIEVVGGDVEHGCNLR